MKVCDGEKLGGKTDKLYSYTHKPPSPQPSCMYFDDRLVGKYRLVPWNPVGHETTVVTFYVRGTLIFP